jgi:hypothetical protein
MSARWLVALPACALSLGLAGPAAARWKVMFIPEEATGVTVSVNGEHVLDWNSREGESIKDIPDKFANLKQIHVRADGSPDGKTARVKVFWNQDEECDMRFDGGQECDAEH